MMTNSELKVIVNRFAKTVPDYTVYSRFKVGTNQAVVVATDTDLTQPIPISSTETIDACEATTGWTAGTDGVITTNSSTYKTGTYALNLTKTGATVDNVIWYNQTEPSLNFTSKDLWGWIYIKDAATLAKLDPTSAVEVRFGNDYNTNYYKLVYALASLAVGWNLVTFNTTTGTQVGTVTLASCDSLGVKLTYTGTAIVTVAGDIVIDDFKLGSSGDYYKNIESGYPTIDETNMQVTNKFYLNTLEANGFSLTGIADFNTDGTVLMGSGFKFTTQSKSSVDEIAFYLRKRLVRR